MSDSLKNQLLGLGYKAAPAPERKPEPHREEVRRDMTAPRGKPAENRKRPEQRGPRPPDGGRPQTPRPGQSPGRPRSQEEIDLAKAYALRSEHEKRERIAAEQKKQDEARLRREAKEKLKALVEGKALNDPQAEHVRHFEYGGKIKRIHVTEAQLRQLNAGDLGVLQNDGRYLLVSVTLLAEAEAIFPAAIALKVDPDAPAADDPYSDPAYQVPDDLVW